LTIFIQGCAVSLYGHLLLEST